MMKAYKKKFIIRCAYNCDESLYDDDPIACYESCIKVPEELTYNVFKYLALQILYSEK